MQRSTDRILTTHTGALRKPADLRPLLARRLEGDQLSASERDTVQHGVKQAVAEVVRRQLEVGLDVIDDGEMSKTSFFDYVGARLGGLERRPGALKLHRLPPWSVEAGLIRSREARDTYRALEDVPGHYRSDIAEFHEFARTQQVGNLGGVATYCVGPLTLEDPSAVRTDIANLQAALAGHPATDVFVPAVSPGMVARTVRNAYYATEEEFLSAIADVMRHEYEAIANAGFVVQLDCPDLASGANTDYADLSVSDFRKVVQLHVEALNYAVRTIPAEQIRIHVCWGNYEGPHLRDIALRDVIDLALQCNAVGISVEAANPRHAHEWKVWQDVKLPDGKVLIPGVVDDKTNFVEHPELVADRLVQYAKLVGRENLMAAPDCGFGGGRCSADIVWAKLRALVEGAALASHRLKSSA
ncbi:MAG: cobalamin-independent methionine synthase II family protein [Chloroflexi bacterium]|nr:cobalamin-independent methionine synthase II family protein [Chloroflexota bacterium]